MGQAYRWIEDSRDGQTAKRLAKLDDPFKVLALEHINVEPIELMLTVVSVPHHYELHQDMPQAPKPSQGRCWHKAQADPSSLVSTLMVLDQRILAA